MLKKWNRSRKLSVVIFFGIFALLLLCNVMTPYAADDFGYMNSFATGEPIASLGDIVPSMAVHAQIMNGRISAHSLVQVFMLMPAWVFDIVNAAVFCLMIWLLTNMDASGEKNNLLAIGAFCAVWLYEPAFGQVNLWQDGAINYLWSVVVILVFLIPFSTAFVLSSPRAYIRGWKTLCCRIGFLVYCFFAGSYSETVSAAGIFMAACLVILDVFCNKRRVRMYDVGCIVSAFLGYVSIYLAPAQWDNKSIEFSVMNIVKNFISVTERYESFGVLVVVYVVLLVFNIYEETNKRIVWLSVVLVLGSLAANYIMILASYYSGRSAVGAVSLLIAADAVLLRPMICNKRHGVTVVSMLAVLVVITAPYLLKGSKDIVATWLKMSENEAYILECKENGDMEVEVPVFHPVTEYSAIYDLKYLDKEDASSWPNHAMAKYYGVNSIIGVDWYNKSVASD